MAGLLLKELKIRGLVKRTLIITPASLSFQWQREMKDKFRENFEVVRSDILRAELRVQPLAGQKPGRDLRFPGFLGSTMQKKVSSAATGTSSLWTRPIK